MSRMMLLKEIIIDAGHGFAPDSTTVEDNGAVANNLNERQFTVPIAQKLRAALIADPMFSGIKIVGDAVDERLNIGQHIEEVKNLQTADVLNESNAILISIHVNSGNGEGTEVWVPARGGKSVELGTDIVTAVTKATGFGLRNPPVKPSNTDRLGRLGILDDTAVLSCLLECGFIQSQQDDLILLNHQDSIVAGIIQGLKAFLRVEMDRSQFLNIAELAQMSAAGVAKFVLQRTILRLKRWMGGVN
jgi:N-acetylmuramoyl-L-alanine amidase